MRFHRTGLAAIALLMAVQGIGCRGLSSRGDHGPRLWSDEWFAQRAQTPEGSPQVQKYGKTWPPYPRPCGRGQTWIHRFYGAHYWPHPYNCQDKAYLRAVSATQIDNGWQQETTLFGYHFDEKDNSLNHAGRLHLKWILQTIPKQRRSVFVQSSDDNAISEARVADVRSVATELVGQGSLPTIRLRISTPDSRPTDEINTMRMKEKAAMRTPQISYTGPGSSGLGGSSGGGGGAQ